MARPLAQAATARDVERLRVHPDAARHGWDIEYDDDVTVFVGLTARGPSADRYLVRLDCDRYDVWPPETRFVNPETRTYALQADQHHLPSIQGFPNFLIHPTFTGFFEAGRTDQLVCCSLTRGYYDSKHTPTDDQRWTPGRHWLYSTVKVLHSALQSVHYHGRLPQVA